MITEIPKIIHYCWFGGNSMPEGFIKYINSWKKYFPDYEIREWNELNFDVNQITYSAQAYKKKKYAYVSDYARFKILYENGGLYFDTDVEAIGKMDDILAKGPFLGCETMSKGGQIPTVAPGLGMAAYRGMMFYGEILKKYEKLEFILHDGRMNLKTVVEYTTELLIKYGLDATNEIQEVCGINIYPKEYFNPVDSNKVVGITANSRLIHHFAGSWMPPFERIKLKYLPVFRRNIIYQKIMAKIKKN